jgi:glycosyltransferase involved in cell wall biosynthesis
MRILLASNASYDPPKGGSTRSNLAWLRHLAAAGHRCRVVSASLAGDSDGESAGISIRSVKNFAQRAHLLGEEVRGFEPDWLLVSSEDLGHVLLRESERAARGRTIYLAHTPQFFPFGPESWNPDPRAAGIVRQARAVVAIGHHMAAYVEQHAGVRPAVIHPPIYGSPPFARCGSFDAPLVLMINPCRVKGIEIFLALAERFPHLEFGALTGWGTTGDDRRAMERFPNVRLLDTVDDIEEVLRLSRVLLMPSLWYEGFGLIAMEAMLRGLPVISSDSGGLVEAKRGTGYAIPVRPVERYLQEFDETHMPRPVIPRQDIEPWTRALAALTTSRDAWEEESRASRSAAETFAGTLDAADFERMLNRIQLGQTHPHRAVDDLTPAQRALLLERLMQRRPR